MFFSKCDYFELLTGPELVVLIAKSGFIRACPSLPVPATSWPCDLFDVGSNLAQRFATTRGVRRAQSRLRQLLITVTRRNTLIDFLAQ